MFYPTCESLCVKASYRAAAQLYLSMCVSDAQRHHIPCGISLVQLVKRVTVGTHELLKTFSDTECRWTDGYISVHRVLCVGGLKAGVLVSLGLAYLVETADDLYPDSVINGTVSRCTNPGTLVFPYCTSQPIAL